MLRALLFALLLPTVAAAQARGDTAAMMRALDELEPDAGWLATPAGLEPEQWSYYRDRYGLSPEGNDPNELRVGLGRMLFFDRRLSRDRTLSCASCHDPRHGFAEPRRTSVGVDGQVVTRNAPTLLNVALQRHFFWDGRAETLEAQAEGPMLNPREMGMPDRDAVVARVREVPEYAALFELAYGRAPTFDDVTRALAAFQRTLVFVDAPFDAFRRGDEQAISADARKGLELFMQHCRACHPINLREPLLSDGNFHNVGVGFDVHDHRAIGKQAFPRMHAAKKDATADVGAIVGEFGELGRALISTQEYQVGAFRTAQLRNVALTAPYMHDGSMATLWEVVQHYNRGGVKNAWQDPQIVKLELDDEQVDQVVAFLFSLTDRRFAAQNDAAFDAQQRAAKRPVIR